jgi:hypothetical protein
MFLAASSAPGGDFRRKTKLLNIEEQEIFMKSLQEPEQYSDGKVGLAGAGAADEK